MKYEGNFLNIAAAAVVIGLGGIALFAGGDCAAPPEKAPISECGSDSPPPLGKPLLLEELTPETKDTDGDSLFSQIVHDIEYERRLNAFDKAMSGENGYHGAESDYIRYRIDVKRSFFKKEPRELIPFSTAADVDYIAFLRLVKSGYSPDEAEDAILNACPICLDMPEYSRMIRGLYDNYKDHDISRSFLEEDA